MNKKNTTIVICACAVLAAGAILLCLHRDHSGLVYSPAGYGGFVHPGKHRAKSNDPLQPAVDAYNKGKYLEAEAEAGRIVALEANSKDPAKRRKLVEARYVLAFSAARRKDMPEARQRFAVLKQEAARLPDKGKQAPMPGAIQPTLEEEGAYQHAVCTAAMGNKKAAEAEYMAFVRAYPESPLVDASVKRIELMHNGSCPLKKRTTPC